MKKRSALLPLLFIFVFFFSGCSPAPTKPVVPSQEPSSALQPLEQSDVAVVRRSDGMTLRYGMSRTEVEAILGTGQERDGSPYVDYLEMGLNVYYREGVDGFYAAGYSLTEGSEGLLFTPRGVTVGDTVSKAKTLYGEIPSITGEELLPFFTYERDVVTGENISSDSPVPEEKQEYLNRMSVTFWFDGDKVVGIDLLDGRMLALGT